MERNPHRPNGADGGCDRHLGPSARLEARDESTCGNLPLLDGPRLEEFIAIGSSRVSASWRASMSSLRRPDSVVGFIMIHYTNSPPSDHGRCEEGTARHRVLHGRWAYLDSRLPVAGVPRLGGHSYRIPLHTRWGNQQRAGQFAALAVPLPASYRRYCPSSWRPCVGEWTGRGRWHVTA